MNNYIDAFVFPVKKDALEDYQLVAEQVAQIWKEYGALAYFEYVGDDLFLEGTQSFVTMLDTAEDEMVVFGWMVFPSQEVRDEAKEQVPKDSRMADLIGPLVQPECMIFDGSRMVYGGFKPFVSVT